MTIKPIPHPTEPRRAPRKPQDRMASKGHPNPVDVYVGSRIRQRRIALGISQENLGNALGLTFQQVQKYERGGNRVSASRLVDLAEILAVDVAWFFDGMPGDVKAQRPAALHGAAPVAITPGKDPLASREALEAFRALMVLPKLQRDLLRKLMRAMAGEGETEAREAA